MKGAPVSGWAWRIHRVCCWLGFHECNYYGFCIHCGCATFSDSPAFEPDGTWDGRTRRIGVNARLFDDFDAALAPIVVIDGKHLW